MMSARARVVTGALLAVATVLAIDLYGIARVRTWNRLGWTGVQFQFSSADFDTKKPPRKRRSAILDRNIGSVFPGSPAARAGLTPADRILTINGHAFRDRAALKNAAETLRVGDEVVYRVSRKGVERTVRVRLASPFRQGNLQAATVIAGITALAFVAIGLFVFVRQPLDRRATVFFAATLNGAVFLVLGFFAGFEWVLIGRGIAIEVPHFTSLSLMMVLTSFFAPLMLHLGLIFPKDRPIVEKSPWVIRWVYAFALLSVAIMVVTLIWVEAVIRKGMGMAALFDPDAGENIILGMLVLGAAALAQIAWVFRRHRSAPAVLRHPLQVLVGSFSILLAGLYSLYYLGFRRAAVWSGIALVMILILIAVLGYPAFTCVMLYRSYRDAGVEEKRQVKWPLWGTIVALGGNFLFSAIAFGIGIASAIDVEHYATWMFAIDLLMNIPRLLYLLIPLSFAFAILKYRLMNIDVIIRKTVVYGLLSGAIVVIYVILVGGIGTLVVTLTDLRNQTMVIVSTLVVALLFVPLRNRLQYLVERNLFRQKFDYADALKAITTEARETTDAGAFLRSASEKLQQALQNRAVVIFVRRQDDFIATAKIGVADTLLGALRFPAGAETVAMFDRPFDPRRRPLEERMAHSLKRIEASLLVPVKSHGSVVAAIACAPKLASTEFDLDDIEFLASVADQMAIGIDRARLQQEDADIAQARQMQEALLPRSLPQLAGVQIAGTWKPARVIGGDYYDVVRLGEHRVAVSIGDVVGKGMPAALLMSALQAAVRASAATVERPAEVCRRVREVVTANLSGGRFITFFYAVLDAAQRTLRFANAGHNPPLLVRADGTVERLATGGPVLARMFEPKYEEGEVAVAGGERLVLYTDGLTEALDAGEEFFGDARLAEIVVGNRHLSAGDLQKLLVDEVLAFSGGELADDLTLVVVAIE